jgi:hypothetical protein
VAGIDNSDFTRSGHKFAAWTVVFLAGELS